MSITRLNYRFIGLCTAGVLALSGCNNVPNEIDGKKVVGQIVGKNCNQTGYPIRAGASDKSEVLVPVYDDNGNMVMTNENLVVEGEAYTTESGRTDNRWIKTDFGNYVVFDPDQVAGGFDCVYRPKKK